MKEEKKNYFPALSVRVAVAAGLEQPRLLGERARQKVGVDGPLGGRVSTVTFFQDLDQN